jgi:anti-anti-sigma factor
MSAIETGSTVSRLAVEGDLTIQTAAATRERLLLALDGSDVIEIDLSGVGEFDSAGLQLLVAMKKSATAAGKQMRLMTPGRSVMDALEFLAVVDDFEWVPEPEKAP